MLAKHLTNKQFGNAIARFKRKALEETIESRHRPCDRSYGRFRRAASLEAVESRLNLHAAIAGELFRHVKSRHPDAAADIERATDWLDQDLDQAIADVFSKLPPAPDGPSLREMQPAISEALLQE